METSLIITITAIIAISILALYFLKKLLDEETYRALTQKIVAQIIKAEFDFKGTKKGDQKLESVIQNITQNATTKEKKILKKINLKSLIKSILSTIVAPILLKGKKV